MSGWGLLELSGPNLWHENNF